MSKQGNLSYSKLLQVPGVISANDVRYLRRDVFGDGFVSKLEADAVFSLNDTVKQKCQQWNEFFVEAMTDFIVNQVEPRGYVTNDNAQWLMKRISHDGVVETVSELELLVRILAKAQSCPPALAEFTLSQIAHAVVEGEAKLAHGLKLTKGAIGKAEVELIRTVLYASGGSCGMSISKKEAEILFDINEKTDAAQNHPDWQDLFVKASASYLMAVSSAASNDRSKLLDRQKWLEDTQVDVGGFMKKMASGLGSGFSQSFFRDVFTSSHAQSQSAWARKNQQMEAQIKASEMIDAQEASWLINRINKDGKINDNEQALLRFIRQQSSHIDPRVIDLMNEVEAA